MRRLYISYKRSDISGKDMPGHQSSKQYMAQSHRGFGSSRMRPRSRNQKHVLLPSMFERPVRSNFLGLNVRRVANDCCTRRGSFYIAGESNAVWARFEASSSNSKAWIQHAE
jgi:hypothetical protein